jgi:histidinol-phosphatase (PHP family)
MIEYVETAINAGVSEMGFSDHLGRYYLGKLQRKRYWDWGMPERDLDRYFEEARELKELFADRIVIRIGLEVDYIEGAEHLVERIVSRYPFDYLLGSVHCIPALGWYHLTRYADADIDKVYTWYFSAARAALQSGLFQSLAHMDFIWRLMKWPEARRADIVQFISETISRSVESGISIEINANGYISSRANYTRQFDPFDLMLDCIAEQKASITLGSDAHAPQLVAKFFPEIISVLKNKGISQVSLFNQKKKQQVQLS